MATFPQVSIDTDLSGELCFVCGQKNPIGLKLRFEQEGDTARAEFTPGEFYQGWPGVVHGGVITCLLDEAMTYAAYYKDIACLTARMEVKWRSLVSLGEPLIITAYVTRSTRKLVETRAQISLRDGTVVAEGTAKQFVIGPRANRESSEGEEPPGNA